MIPEGLYDHGAHLEDFGHVLAPDHHVPVVKLHVHLGILVEQVVGAPGRGQAQELPVVAAQLVASRRLPGKGTQTLDPCTACPRRSDVNPVSLKMLSPHGSTSQVTAL